MPPATADLPSIETLRATLAQIDQPHLLTFWDELDPPQQDQLRADIASINLEHVPGWVEQYVRAKPSFAPSGTIDPPPSYAFDDTTWDVAHYRQIGETLLREGKVAAFTVAGGQGTRLGYDGPKGCYPGTPVTRKPLFRVFAEWLIAANRRWKTTIPWYIMTSPLNHDATRSFFEQHNHFDLDPANIMFFPQGVMPSFDMTTGRILLANKHAIATNPDGHGGSLRALATSGALADMHTRGIEQISYFQVDNPLCRVVDPVFLGLHAAAPDSSGEMSTKVVSKTEPGEKVGVVAQVDGVTQVLEYSDLSDELTGAREPDGRLRLRAGNIAIHAISVDFVERLNAGGECHLPFHRAEKKVQCIDPTTGATQTPDTPNAVKLEMFVFDAIPLAGKTTPGQSTDPAINKGSIVYEVDRVDEFAPIKNAQGNDSPATSARLQTERIARWLEWRKHPVPRRADGSPDCTLEISPITAMTKLDLQSMMLPEIAPGATLAL